MGLIWEESRSALLNRQEWRRAVAQCIYLDVVKVQGSECNAYRTRYYVWPYGRPSAPLSDQCRYRL